ncbi:MAG: Na+/H+ antiporter subunit D [Ignavibacteriaceae bacterium]|nr:Na+/H+ antiporter subunit D [Ignavibacteriaceae bacterium]
MDFLISLPVILPLFSAILCVFLRDYVKAQKTINFVTASLLLVISFTIGHFVYHDDIIVLNSGNWSAPFGIVLVADLFASSMLMVSNLVYFAVVFYTLNNIDKEREKLYFYPLLNTLMMGVNGAFLTGDIFNLYVWFEVMLISSFVLITIGGEKSQLEGAIKYVTLNLISSFFFLTGVGFLYGLTGTLNMADLSVQISNSEPSVLIDTVSLLFLAAFGIKSAVFPLFFWLPASYHTPPVVVSAIFAGLLTKVGVYSLIRVFTLIFTQNTSFTSDILVVIAGFTMITGVLGAAAQNDIRRILSFHIVSQIGYMIMGLGLNTALALTGSIFYILHHIIVKTNLFLVGGLVDKVKGSFALPKLGGVYKAYPFFGVLFLISALSLAGIPPLSGFWAKFTIAKAGVDISAYFIVGVALLTGILTLFSMMKIWNEAFWKEQPADCVQVIKVTKKDLVLSVLPVVLLASVTVLIGVFAGSVFEYAEKVTAGLTDSTNYINAVLRRISE